MNKIIISMLLFSILLFGCLGEPEAPEEPEEETPPEEEYVPNPTFTIVNPENGMTITTNEEFAEITVSISAQNLVVKSPGGSAKKGEGHFHFMLDGGDPIIVSTKTYTLVGLEDGDHSLTVALMNNDHTPYGVSNTVSFAIERENLEYVPEEYEVSIKDFSYEPEELTVNVDDKVTFVNDGAYPRSATCFVDGEQVFDSEIIGPGEKATVTMETAADCEYYSLTHMAMKGHMTILAHE